jgi:hypothetical protein
MANPRHPRQINIRSASKIADRILSSQAMTLTSGDTRNSDLRSIGNFFRRAAPFCVLILSRILCHNKHVLNP